MNDFDKKLLKVIDRYREIQDTLNKSQIYNQEYVKLTKEITSIEPLVQKIVDYQKIQKEISELKILLDDKELKDSAAEEIEKLSKDSENIIEEIKIMLLPKDKLDEKNSIIEIRAGTGGAEAALFAADLFNMYIRYAELKKWKYEIISILDIGIGGYKSATVLVKGENVFSRLKFESGVHRVQRIPSTESSGRVHTSAVAVAVLPEAEEVEVKLDDKDLKIDTCRASGAGGQHLNTTDSAVRILHIPTGIVVTQQDERSQHKNKAKALKILRAKVYELMEKKQQEEESQNRKQQIGSGDRSERIRTYNFPQGRITDHRINLTLYQIQEIVTEGKLDKFIDNLIAADRLSKISEF